MPDLAGGAAGVLVWVIASGDYSRPTLFSYLAGWIAVTTGAAGVYGFARDDGADAPGE